MQLFPIVFFVIWGVLWDTLKGQIESHDIQSTIYQRMAPLEDLTFRML